MVGKELQIKKSGILSLRTSWQPSLCMTLLMETDDIDSHSLPDTFLEAGQQLRRPSDSKSLSETIVRIQ